MILTATAGQGAGVSTPAAAASLDALGFAPPHADGITAAMISLAEWVMTLLIVAASILLTVGIATGAVQGLFATTVGSPYALASSWFKIITIIILAVIAFGSRLIAQTVINAIAGSVVKSGIPLFL
jgi:hypothetical protein